MARYPNTVGHTTSYANAFSERAQPYTDTATSCQTQSPVVVRLRSALAAASLGVGRRCPCFAFGPRCPCFARGTRGSYNAASPRNRPTNVTRSSRSASNPLVA